MKLSLFLGCVLLSILVVASGHTFDSTLDEDWKSWKSQYEKQYTEEEETYRRMIWEDNVKYIEQHNLEYSMGKHTFTVGMNQFGDLTTKEINEHMNGFRPDKAINLAEEEFDEGDEDDVDNVVFDEDAETNDDLQVENIDWRTRNWVTPVQNQGNCGSCWAFSATGAIEGQWAKRHGQLISLSEQNLVDCDSGNDGCNGGTLWKAFHYVKENGINSEKTYPYTGQSNLQCKFQRNKIAARINGYRSVGQTEKALKDAVHSIGPIAVAVDATHKSFHLYRGGIYYEPNCSFQLTHAMLVVGYGSEERDSYWLVKTVGE
ncbi:procathepsin L-like isoform X2 [Scyliorhinus canicula]|uniref:procathepsin L-like isoform X2 n=1 Tax=Scyliorhinus canicula TaxID=7830 RepID=UPI0018F488C1|nr:procathepsin L-like isoform X2 [Scyliorhinus canicula]